MRIKLRFNLLKVKAHKQVYACLLNRVFLSVANLQNASIHHGHLFHYHKCTRPATKGREHLAGTVWPSLSRAFFCTSGRDV